MTTIKLKLVDRLKVLLNGNYSTHIDDFLSGNSMGNGGVLSLEAAMKYSAVMACVRVLSETFASVPVIIYKKKNEGRDIYTKLPISDALRYRPNPEMSPFTFKETLMTNFTTGGNSVSEKLYNGKDRLVGLKPYPDSAVTIERDTNGNLIYKIKGEGNTEKILRRDQVLHVPNLSFDGIIGLSPIAYASQSIKLGLSYETSQVQLYKNGVTPSGVFETDTGLSEKARDRLTESLMKNYAGLQNVGKPMVLEDGLKWNQVTINPIDVQLLENKYFQIEDIARIYRVPQHLLNKLDRSTFNNIEQLSLEFVMFTMLPIFKRFEDNMNMQLLTLEQQKAGIYIEFKIDGLLRGDMKSRAEAYAAGRQWGYLSANDIRRLESMPKIDNGDIYLTPMNFTEAGKETEQNAQNNAKLLKEISNMLSERG